MKMFGELYGRVWNSDDPLIQDVLCLSFRKKK